MLLRLSWKAWTDGSFTTGKPTNMQLAENYLDKRLPLAGLSGFFLSLDFSFPFQPVWEYSFLCSIHKDPWHLTGQQKECTLKLTWYTFKCNAILTGVQSPDFTYTLMGQWLMREKDIGVMVVNTTKMPNQYMAAVKKANFMLWITTEGTEKRTDNITSPFYSTVVQLHFFHSHNTKI